eukprot:1943640-Pyramimonas_sp.AAC.1
MGCGHLPRALEVQGAGERARGRLRCRCPARRDPRAGDGRGDVQRLGRPRGGSGAGSAAGVACRRHPE